MSRAGWWRARIDREPVPRDAAAIAFDWLRAELGRLPAAARDEAAAELAAELVHRAELVGKMAAG